MDGSLVWSNRHHQSGTMMPSGAVHPIIPGRAAGANPESILPVVVMDYRQASWKALSHGHF
jgi:hypothetical protein